jgi:hypothetical protein
MSVIVNIILLLAMIYIFITYKNYISEEGTDIIQQHKTKVIEYKYMHSLFDKDRTNQGEILKIYLKHYIDSADIMGYAPSLDKLYDTYMKKEYPNRKEYYNDLVQMLSIMSLSNDRQNKLTKGNITMYLGAEDSIENPLTKEVNKYYKGKIIKYYKYEFCKDPRTAVVVINQGGIVEHITIDILPIPPLSIVNPGK